MTCPASMVRLSPQVASHSGQVRNEVWVMARP